MEDADKKMAELSKQGKIDPAFLQITAKAYGAARDTEMTKEESKWVAYKLYRQARDHFDREQPTEKRILEYLLTIRDPVERSNQLDKVWSISDVSISHALLTFHAKTHVGNMRDVYTGPHTSAYRPTHTSAHNASYPTKAITPGPTRNTDTHDYMWTTPTRLFAVLDGTIRAFEAMQTQVCVCVCELAFVDVCT